MAGALLSVDMIFDELLRENQNASDRLLTTRYPALATPSYGLTTWPNQGQTNSTPTLKARSLAYFRLP